jgi:hypothetical protein
MGGTVVVIFVAETTVQVFAAVVLNLIEQGEVNPVPLIVTTLPTPLEVGVNEVIVESTKSFFGLVAVSAPAVTLTAPEVAVAGTVASIFSAEMTLKWALTSSMDTLVTLVNLRPVTTTTAPPLAREGLTKVIIGRVRTEAVAGPAASGPPAKVDRAITAMATGRFEPRRKTLMTSPSVVCPTPFVGDQASVAPTAQGCAGGVLSWRACASVASLVLAVTQPAEATGPRGRA